MKHVRANITSRVPRFSDIVFGVVFLVLLGALVLAFTEQQGIRSANDQLKTQLTKLRQHDRILTEQKRQARQDEDVIMKVFQRCRSASDIPDLQGKRFVSNVIDGDCVVFYVPGGKHTMHINTSWESSPLTPTGSLEGGQKPAGNPSATKAIKGNRHWQVPLREHTGYRFAVTKSEREKAPIGWRLISNAEQPYQLSEKLPLPPIRTSGASWSSFRVLDVPNLIPLRSIVAKSTSAASAQSLQIGRWTKSASHDGQHLKIYFDLRIHSDGPKVITAEGAETLTVMRRTDLIGDYLGEGIYLAKE